MDTKKLQNNAIKAHKNQKRTLEEKEISNILRKNKIKFNEQMPVIEVGNKAGIIIVDFLVKFNDKKIVIETSNFNLKKLKKDFKRKLKLRARLLAHRSFRIKLHCPKLKLIAAIKMNTSNEMVIAILKEIFDIVIVNDFSIIPDVIKEMCAGGRI